MQVTPCFGLLHPHEPDIELTFLDGELIWIIKAFSGFGTFPTISWATTKVRAVVFFNQSDDTCLHSVAANWAEPNAIADILSSRSPEHCLYTSHYHQDSARLIKCSFTSLDPPAGAFWKLLNALKTPENIYCQGGSSMLVAWRTVWGSRRNRWCSANPMLPGTQRTLGAAQSSSCQSMTGDFHNTI